VEKAAVYDDTGECGGGGGGGGGFGFSDDADFVADDKDCNFFSPAAENLSSEFFSPETVHSSSGGVGKDGAKETEALSSKVKTCQESLNVSEAELERLVKNASDFFVDECELLETLIAVQKDPIFYLVTSNNKTTAFSRKYAMAVKTQRSCLRALQVAQEEILNKDVNTSTFEFKVDIKAALKEHEAVYERKLEKLESTLSTVTSRLERMDQQVDVKSALKEQEAMYEKKLENLHSTMSTLTTRMELMDQQVDVKAALKEQEVMYEKKLGNLQSTVSTLTNSLELMDHQQVDIKAALTEQEAMYEKKLENLQSTVSTLTNRLELMDQQVDIKAALNEQEAIYEKKLENLQSTVSTLTNRLELMDHALGQVWNEDILNKATIAGDVATVEYLVNKGVIPTVRIRSNYVHNSALHHACWEKKVEVVRILISKSKAIINSEAEYGHAQLGRPRYEYRRSPLQLAAAAACLPVVELLMANGAEIPRPSYQHNASFRIPSGADGNRVAEFLQVKLQVQNKSRPKSKEVSSEKLLERF
jgi:predicted nuclease with TOPRIM domain